MSRVKKVHILGNGLSINKFPLDTDGVRIGTNFSDAKLKPVWTFINDRVPLDKVLSKEVVLEYPIIISTRASEKSDLFTKDYDKTIIKFIIDFIKYPELHPTLGLNSAQMATYVAIKQFQPNEVHLWGCDSLWKDDISSSTDLIIPKAPNKGINELWVSQWGKLISEYPKISFYLHSEGESSLAEQENLNIQSIQ